MTTKRANTRLAGHELPREGRLNPAFNWADGDNGPGRTRCSCGHSSPRLPSTAARKRWHREHKDEIRSRLTKEPTDV